MKAPVLVEYQQSTWTGLSAASEVTAVVTWQTGDVILVLGVTEDQPRTLGLPTATGLTFTSIQEGDKAGSCHTYAWRATAGANGSSAITSTTDGASAARGLSAFVYRGHGGVGASVKNSVTDATSVVSLSRSGANSAVAWCCGDFTASTDVTVAATPAGGTQRVAVTESTRATFFVFDWGDQGAVTTTNFGITGASGSNHFMIAVEVLGVPAPSDQYGFRARNDDGSETTATWKAAQDAPFTMTPDETFRLRIGVNTTGDPDSTQYKLQYRKVGASSWRDVDTSG
jgi:hypothetical protein